MILDLIAKNAEVKEFKNFYFERYDFDVATMEASFFYSFDEEIFFEEKICFWDENFSVRKDFDREILDGLLFHVHLALGMSYYKFFPTKNLIVKTAKIDEYQQNFWKKMYLNGLWEFFYTNNFDPTEVAIFESQSEKIFLKKDFWVQEKSLVAIGWWKDSIVSIELLKNAGKDFDLVTLAVQDNILYQNTQKIAGKKRLSLERKFQDYSHLLQEWYYNWHVAITWMIAFVLEVAAYLYEYKNIVLSNEKSANFWNIFWKWIEVNHQYSKSLQFEKDFWEYVENYMTANVKYFSFLRPFYELKIAELFAKYGKKYFKEFSSCNTNFKIFKEKYQKNHTWYWCLECPKCAFVYAILRPFLTKEETFDIFGEELYEKKSLEKLFRELLGISGIKPFECVGTNEEVIFAMKKSLDTWKWKLPYILEIFALEVDKNMSENDYKKLEEKIMIPDFSQDIIPEDLKTILLHN